MQGSHETSRACPLVGVTQGGLKTRLKKKKTSQKLMEWSLNLMKKRLMLTGNHQNINMLLLIRLLA
jgi:hypothetical protein